MTFHTTLVIELDSVLELEKKLCIFTPLVEAELSIAYSVSKFYPETATSPEEPAELEIDDWVIQTIYSVHGVPIELSQKQVNAIEDLIDSNQYDELGEKMELACWEDQEGMEFEVRR